MSTPANTPVTPSSRARPDRSAPAYPFESDPGPGPAPAVGARSRHATTTDGGNRSSSGGGRSVVWRWVSFLAGCVLLVGCAWVLAHRLQHWTDRYGAILVFLVFFLVMSLAGRWFWAGIDAALGRVIRGGHQ